MRKSDNERNMPEEKKKAGRSTRLEMCPFKKGYLKKIQQKEEEHAATMW